MKKTLQYKFVSFLVKFSELVFAGAVCFFIFLVGMRAPLLHAQVEASPAVSANPVGTRYVYKKVNGRELSIFVESPAGSLQGKKYPALLFFHGGAWVGGPLNEFDRQVQYLAGRGLVGIQVEYRVVPAQTTESIDPAIEDTKSAIRWVRAHAALLGVDANRIGTSGASAGGQLAAFPGMMTGKDDPADDLSISAMPNIMVLLNPAIDLGPESACCHKHGGDTYKDVSPRYHVHAGIPPALILHGTDDHLVAPEMIAKFAEEMKQDGNDCTLVLYPGSGHGFFNFKDNFYKTLEQIDIFLSAHSWLQGTPDERAIHTLPPTPTDRKPVKTVAQ